MTMASSDEALLSALAQKYMQILGVEGRPPLVEVRANLGAGWLGMCRWSSKDPSTSRIEIQRAILSDPRTTERVMAHEIIHHRDYLRMSDRVTRLLRHGIRPEYHGATFLEGAARINARMGDGFVTVTSDKDYVLAENKKPFFVLIVPVGKDRLGWAWAVRLSADGQKRAAAEVAKNNGAVLLQTTDARLALGKAKIARRLSLNIPDAGTERDTILRALYAQHRA